MTLTDPAHLAELLADEGLEPVRKLVGRPWPTIVRWIRTGLRGIRLEAIRDGGRWVTSKAALARFRARLTGLDVPTPVEKTRTVAERNRAVADAVARIRAMGKKSKR